jgi:hypothetical protein
LSTPISILLGLLIAVAVLPLAAQYVRQRGLLEGLSEPLLLPAVTPFVERVGLHRPRPLVRRVVHHHAAVRVRHIARRPHVHKRIVAFVAPRVAYRPPARRHVRHASVADASRFGVRARLSVRSYLHALIAGDIPAALGHLGLPRNAGTAAISELPILASGTSVAIVGSKPSARGEQVQADIVTGAREYYEVFYVTKDGPAVRITDRYYIPVNRRAQIASRATRTE